MKSRRVTTGRALSPPSEGSTPVGWDGCSPAEPSFSGIRRPPFPEPLLLADWISAPDARPRFRTPKKCRQSIRLPQEDADLLSLDLKRQIRQTSCPCTLG